METRKVYTVCFNTETRMYANLETAIAEAEGYPVWEWTADGDEFVPVEVDYMLSRDEYENTEAYFSHVL